MTSISLITSTRDNGLGYRLNLIIWHTLHRYTFMNQNCYKSLAILAYKYICELDIRVSNWQKKLKVYNRWTSFLRNTQKTILKQQLVMILLVLHEINQQMFTMVSDRG